MKKRKKIIYIVTKGNFGGAQKYVYDLSTSLPQDEFEILVISGRGEKLIQKLQEKNVRARKIDLMQRDISLLKEILSFFELTKIFFEERPDIIHLNSPKAGGLGSLASRLYQLGTWNLNLKIIYTAHGWPFNEDVSGTKKILRKFFSWLTVLLSSKTITISKDNFEQGLRMPLLSKKISFIYNGIKEPEFYDKEKARKILSEKSRADTEKTWVGTISELHKNKGLEYAIKAISKIDNVCFFIIGEGEEREVLQKLIAEENLENKVFLIGYLDDAVKYLKAFDIFTLTSIKEGHPYTLLEAGFAGIPIVGSNIPGIKDILKDKNNFLVEPKKPDVLAKKITGFLNNPENTALISHNLSLSIRKSFSFEKFINETTKIYTN